jgi:hypothetical protein
VIARRFAVLAASLLGGLSGTIAATPATATSAPSDGPVLSPASISGRKILDQNGDVYLMRTFSSWSMASNLTDDEITTALEGVAANGFNAVTVWIGGGYDLGGWHRYTNAAGDEFWEGTPWQSALGPAWSSVDHLVDETNRLGLAVNLSFCGGYGETGARLDWEAATNEQMYDVGVAVASRYRDDPNIVWHVMFDDTPTRSTPAGERIDALFSGINDTEGAATRPVRWAEPNNGASIYNQLLASEPPFDAFNLTLNGWYQYGSNSAEIAEAGWAETDAYPVGDVEPPYDGSPHYGGDIGQQLRERSYATFLEGGSYINYGQEDWWPFGAQGLYSEGLSWNDVTAHEHTVQQSYVWSLLDEYVADVTWAPTDAFLVDGEDSGDNKAAAGASESAAIAYFPTARDVVVDTTILPGDGNVRLRWYDPTSGGYTGIADAEPRNPSRSVPYPEAHPDSTQDWVLVVDLAA